MAELQEIPSLDILLRPQVEGALDNSWSSPPLGFLLLIEEAPPTDFFLSIDDSGNRLLIA